MRSFLRPLSSFVLVGSVVLAFSSPAGAEAKDAAAKKLEQDAMETDYLATSFAKAEKKLDDAIKLCGASNCSPAVSAHLHISRGIVLGGGQNKLDAAKSEFVAALKLDPTVQLDKDLTTPELAFAFQEAKSQAGVAATGSTPAPATDEKTIAHKPPAEQAIDTPLPIYAELPSGVSATHVQLKYKPPGADDYKSMELPQFGKGYGGAIPCGDLGHEGDLEYYLQALDATDAVVVSGGTRAQPFRVAIRASLLGDAPHLPGQPPPKKCVTVSKPSPDKAVRPPCESDRECDEGFACNERHQCEPRATDEPPPEEPPSTAKKNWFSVSFGADLSLISGNDVCTEDSQANDHYGCFYGNGQQFHGAPIPGRFDNIKAGVAPSTMRVMLGYDRLFGRNLTIGLRAGYAFGGGPKPDGDAASSFFPLHIDARVAYYLGKDPFSRIGVRPFAFAVAGMMEVDTKVSVEVHEPGAACGQAADVDCVTKLDAWRRAGNGFVGLGVGAQYAVSPGQALVLDIRGEQLFPAPATVFTPEVGFVTGF